MSNVLTVALLQVEAAGYDQRENLRRGEAACRQAASLGADIALFPEMWNIGYGFDRDRAPEAALTRWRSQAIARDGVFVSHFGALAAELGLAIAITYLEAWPGGPRNTVTLFDRRGREVLTYAKVHICAFDWHEAALTPGDGFPVATLDTIAGPLQVGAMICFDREVPGTARILALDGAELILVPNACPMEDNRTAQLRARAFEDMVGVALANYPAGHDDCDGHSVAFHPCIADAHGASRDTWSCGPVPRPTSCRPASTSSSCAPGAALRSGAARFAGRRGTAASSRGLWPSPSAAVTPPAAPSRRGRSERAAARGGPSLAGDGAVAAAPPPDSAASTSWRPGCPVARRSSSARSGRSPFGGAGMPTWAARDAGATPASRVTVAPPSRCAGTPTISSAATRPAALGWSTRVRPSVSSQLVSAAR